MQIGYSCMGKKLSSASKHLAIALGLIAIPVTFKFDKAHADVPKQPIAKAVPPPSLIPTSRPDARTQRLRRFLASLHCPVSYLAEDFIQAADDNHIDWRLLPSISVVESGGGKAYKNNNIFGWANGDHLFPTVRSAIHEVAYKLGRSSLYRNRGVEAKLHIYNPDETYAQSVMSVMNRISPAYASD